MDISPAVLRSRYRSREIKPSDVMEYVLGRLHDDDQANVWISLVDADRAIKAAQELDDRIDEIEDLPLYGTILSVKDCVDVAGIPTTAACPAFSYVPQVSSPVVDRLLAAGALYIGKTNMDQFATGLVGVRSPYGIPTNPHNPAYIPGGSSSGAAVSVATGTSSIALATDTGGSGRVPASYCGIVGLKPGPGALSGRGMVHACRSFETLSFFSRSPVDAYTALRVSCAHDPLDGFSTRDYRCSPVDMEKAPENELRIAAPSPGNRKYFGNGETQQLFEYALRRIEEISGAVETVDYSLFDKVNQLMYFGPLVAERDLAVGEFLRAHPDKVLPVVRDLILGSDQWSAKDAYRAHYEIADARAELDLFWRNYDVFVVPTVGTLVTVQQVLAEPLQHNFNNGYYTNFANPLGMAAVSVPGGVTGVGVPYGVTFLGPSQSEGMLVRLAEVFLAGSV